MKITQDHINKLVTLAVVLASIVMLPVFLKNNTVVLNELIEEQEAIAEKIALDSIQNRVSASIKTMKDMNCIVSRDAGLYDKLAVKDTECNIANWTGPYIEKDEIQDFRRYKHAARIEKGANIYLYVKMTEPMFNAINQHVQFRCWHARDEEYCLTTRGFKNITYQNGEAKVVLISQ